MSHAPGLALALAPHTDGSGWKDLQAPGRYLPAAVLTQSIATAERVRERVLHLFEIVQHHAA